jgi:Mg-chelatase subunit ChlD
MPVRHEIKSQLAKLLATEDLVVEHKKVDTACFNVHTRVLTLPLWEKASGTVYDLLVGHEVGHAIFTPDEDWSENCKVPQQFLNVVEDARVEKLMKRKYMGLAKTFFNGYKELNDQDFFQLSGEDVSKFNLADRVNLYFKVGNFLPLVFNPEEKEIVELIASTETFADVLIAAEELYKYCKKENEQQKLPDLDFHQGNKKGAESPTNETVETKADQDSDENNSNSSNQFESETSKSGNSQGQQISSASDSSEQEEPEVRTLDSLENKIRDLVNDSGAENIYIEIPNVTLNTVIASNSEVHDEINNSFRTQQEKYTESTKNSESLFKFADEEFKKFKLSSQKEVNYLVKEFECRKAADQYARASTARTGVLDTARLHSYKFSEDLFKKVTILPDGKNHGLVFILDWSGSMQNVLLDTCKQLFNLIWFCKKVSIPFEVYAFTNEWRRYQFDYETGNYLASDRTRHYEKKEYVLDVSDDFSLMNILTSKVSGNQLEKQMLNIWRIAACFRNTYACNYTYPTRLCLSGTPLNEALVCLHQILPKFQQENKLQKVQCIVLTDGEASHIPYTVEIKRAWDKEPYMGTRHVNPSTTILRDRKLGATYNFGDDEGSCGYSRFTDILLNNLKDKFPTVNFIGIRVLESRQAQNFISMYHKSTEKQYEVIQNDWRKLKSFTITKSGYDAYFGLSSTALSQESEFEVGESATKAQIKSAFVKSLKTKKLNKKVLGEFISLVA